MIHEQKIEREARALFSGVLPEEEIKEYIDLKIVLENLKDERNQFITNGNLVVMTKRLSHLSAKALEVMRQLSNSRLPT